MLRGLNFPPGELTVLTTRKGELEKLTFDSPLPALSPSAPSPLPPPPHSSL